jgi:hypothetical protein
MPNLLPVSKPKTEKKKQTPNHAISPACPKFVFPISICSRKGLSYKHSSFLESKPQLGKKRVALK